MSWHDQAACAGVGPSLWFADDSTDHSTMQAARAVCHACPVRLDCLDWALDNGEIHHGMWGGLTPKQRQAEARMRFGSLPRPIATFEHGRPTSHTACARRNGGSPCGDCKASRNVYIAERRELYGRSDRPRRVAS